MASMNVSVPDPMRDWVQARIDTGKYASVSDYVRDLIRRDQSRSVDEERWLTTLDGALSESLADAEAGRVHDASGVFDRLNAKYTAMAETQTPR
jgi:antitoxin ParD1/3/4